MTTTDDRSQAAAEHATQHAAEAPAAAQYDPASDPASDPPSDPPGGELNTFAWPSAMCQMAHTALEQAARTEAQQRLRTHRTAAVAPLPLVEQAWPERRKSGPLYAIWQHLRHTECATARELAELTGKPSGNIMPLLKVHIARGSIRIDRETRPYTYSLAPAEPAGAQPAAQHRRGRGGVASVLQSQCTELLHWAPVAPDSLPSDDRSVLVWERGRWLGGWYEKAENTWRCTADGERIRPTHWADVAGPALR